MTGALPLVVDVLTVVPGAGMLAEDSNNFGDTRGGALAGPLGLFLIVALGIATWLLIRNMNKRLRRLPREFPEPDRDRAEGAVRDPRTADDEPPGPPGR